MVTGLRSALFGCGRGPIPARSRGAPPPREDRASGAVAADDGSECRAGASAPADLQAPPPGFCPLNTLNKYHSDGISAAAPNGSVIAVRTSVGLGAALDATVKSGAIR